VYSANDLKETVVKINTTQTKVVSTRILVLKPAEADRNQKAIATFHPKKSKRPSIDLQKVYFWTFCMGHCKGSLDIRRIATMTSPPLETISINVILEAPKMRSPIIMLLKRKLHRLME
jgi:hypothetical protein